MRYSERVRNWVRRWTETRELDAVGPGGREALARDLGAPVGLLERCVALGAGTGDRLNRMLRALSLDPAALKVEQPAAMRDLAATCCGCHATRRCERDLASGEAHASFREFCPNADTLRGLRDNAGQARAA